MVEECHNSEDLSFNPIDRNIPNVIFITTGNIHYCFLPEEIYEWVVRRRERINPYNRIVIPDRKINEIIDTYNRLHPEAIERDRGLQNEARRIVVNEILEDDEDDIEDEDDDVEEDEEFQNGQRHRDNDLPAVIEADGTQEWWRNGVRQNPPQLEI